MNRLLYCLLFLLCLLASQCQEKYLNVFFLDPLERNKEGYLDPQTFQVLAEATAFDPANIENLEMYFPLEVTSDFGPEELQAYNDKLKEEKLTKRKIRKLPLEKRPLKYIQVLETRAERIPDETLAISVADKRIRLAAGLNKRLFNQACRQAKVRALYRWFLLAEPSIAGRYKRWESNLASYKPKKKKNTEVAAKSQLELLTHFSNINFPPKIFFTRQNRGQLAELKEKLENLDFEYELIDEVQHDPAFFSCKVVVHIKQSSLINKYSHLIK